MHKAFSERQFDGFKASEDQLNYMMEKYPSAVPAAKYRYTAKAVELAGLCFSAGGDRTVFKRLKQELNRFSGEVLRDPNTKRSMKLRIYAMKLGYYPAKAVIRFHEKLKERML